ncbi:hypothetical protein D3C77_711730 [compost metagenome]
MVLLDPLVDNLQVVQLQFQFHLGQEASFLTVAVEYRDLLVRMQDSQRNARHTATAADIEPTLAVDKRHDAQAVE